MQPTFYCSIVIELLFNQANGLGGVVAGKQRVTHSFFLMLFGFLFLPYFAHFQALKQQQQRNQRRQGGMPASSSPRLLLKTIKDMTDNISTKTGRWQRLNCQRQN